MSILDGALASIPGAPDTIVSLAQSAGVDPAMAEKAVMVLTRTHVATGDTISLAASRTGLDTSVLATIVAKLGGEATLSALADTLSVGLGELGRGSFLEGIIPGFG
ncbi:MAG: hypothetical protein AAFQ90_11010 [Pseudomonadota bacterium]